MTGQHLLASGASKGLAFDIGSKRAYLSNLNYITGLYDESLYFYCWEEQTFYAGRTWFVSDQINMLGHYLQFKHATPAITNEFTVDWMTYNGVDAYQTVASFVQSNPARLDIHQAGDINILDDKFIKIGKDSDGTLPTASAAYLGKMIRIERSDPNPDFLLICMKGYDMLGGDFGYHWYRVGISYYGDS